MRATWISAVLVVMFYVGSTASILIFLRPDDVSPVIGLAQASRQAAHLLSWRWLPLAIAISILLRAWGQLGTYVGACARLPFVLGIGNMLPPAFAKLHPKYGTPFLSILFLGGCSALLLIISQLGETFSRSLSVHGGLNGCLAVCAFSLYLRGGVAIRATAPGRLRLPCFVRAIAFSFLPAPDIRSVFWFETKLMGGCILLFVLARL